MKLFLKHIVAKEFFPKYAPEVANWRHKCSGKNSKGNPVKFTETDKIAISQGLNRMRDETMQDIRMTGQT